MRNALRVAMHFIALLACIAGACGPWFDGPGRAFAAAFALLIALATAVELDRK